MQKIALRTSASPRARITRYSFRRGVTVGNRSLVRLSTRFQKRADNKLGVYLRNE